MKKFIHDDPTDQSSVAINLDAENYPCITFCMSDGRSDKYSEFFYFSDGDEDNDLKKVDELIAALEVSAIQLKVFKEQAIAAAKEYEEKRKNDPEGKETLIAKIRKA